MTFNQVTLQDYSSHISGGIIGFYCAYKYAHHTSRAHALLPWALKGVDVAIYSVFRSLGLEVSVRPILISNALDEMVLEYNIYENNDKDSQGVRVGDALHKLALDSHGGYDECPSDIEQVCRCFFMTLFFPCSNRVLRISWAPGLMRNTGILCGLINLETRK